MTDPRNRQYTNGEITVFWVPSKCIHATTCFRELIEVFNPGRRPWVNMEGAPTRKIIEVVNKCPTQSLAWKYNKDLTEEEKKAQKEVGQNLEETPKTLSGKNAPTSIRIMKDGPIVAEGSFKIIDAKNQELKPSTMTSFCRCGASRNMPYCDGSHRKIDFNDQSAEKGE
ncbi:MAG: (4Fe-4S)-binding protein [Bacteroidales bacterium]|nr:(4Fe-4S)-binding protein [Bacteroidales bacterium]